MGSDQLRAALERWYWLLKTELLCPDNPAETDWGAVALVAAQTRAALATPPAMEEPADLPEGFIDPEHQGAALELLQTFYQASRSEGGTTDEICLRGLRAVLAAARSNTPAPVEGEVGKLVEFLDTLAAQSILTAAYADKARRAAALLQQQATELARLRAGGAAVALEESDWSEVALIAQDMRSRGLAEHAAGQELLKLANERRSPPIPQPPQGGEVEG